MPTDSFDLAGFAMAQSAAFSDPAARIAAEASATWGIAIVPLVLLVLWFRHREGDRPACVTATLSGVAALSVAGLLSFLVYEPRPFTVNLSANLLGHVADSSFPSDHVTLMIAVASSLVRSNRRRAGGLIAVAGAAVAFARVAFGIHFPIDVVAGVLIGVAAAAAFRLPPAARFADFVVRIAEALYTALRLDVFEARLAKRLREEWAR